MIFIISIYNIYYHYYKVDSMIEKAQALGRPGSKYLVMSKNRNYNT